MHLFNYATFGKRFGIGTEVDDFKNAILAASRAATQDLASTMRFTEFGSYSNRVDWFFVNRTFGIEGGYQIDFRLSRGLVTGGYVANYYADPKTLRYNLSDTYDLKDINEDGQSDTTFLDEDRGILTVVGVDLTGQWVRVDYSGGLTIDGEDFVQPPDWLREAALAQAAIALNEHRSLTTEGDNDLTELKMLVQNAFQAHARYAPSAVQPRSSEG